VRRRDGYAGVYDGPADEGEAVVQPLRELGTAVLDFSGKMPYCAIQSLYDGLFPKGRDRSYFKSLYLSSLGDAVIADITGQWASRPSSMSLTSVWRFGGAVQCVAPDATAFGDRNMPYMLSIDSIWSNPEDDQANIAWSRDFWSAMQRHSTGRLYPNFAGLGEDEDLVRQAHGAEVYARLSAIKRTHDPDSFFRMNQNIGSA
jgi:hypothetical protein